MHPFHLSSADSDSCANTSDIQNKTYTYTNDGSIKQSTNSVDSNYSQNYQYDFAARLKKNDVGGLGTSTPGSRYKQTLGYDTFDNHTSRSTTDDGTTRSFTAGYTNNRKTSGGYVGSVDNYDAAGNIVHSSRSYPDATNWKFDVAGRVAYWLETSSYLGTTRWDQGETLTFDGDGRTVTREKRSRVYAFPETGWSQVPEHYIYSSVTGQKVLEVDENGARKQVNIYMGSTLIAEHKPDGVAFKHTDPVTGSVMQTTSSGEKEAGDFGRIETEALGAVLATQPPESPEMPHDFGKGGSTSNPETGCELNGTAMSCSRRNAILRAMGLLTAGGQLVLATVSVTSRNRLRVRNTVESGLVAVGKPWTQVVRTDVSLELVNLQADGVFGGDDSLSLQLSKTPVPRSLPCPPKLSQLVGNRQLKKTLNDLLVSKSGHRTENQLENGGWIYLYIQGPSKGSFFFQPVDENRRSSGSIDLENPPAVRNTVVIAKVHTHPYSTYYQNNANRMEGAGQQVNLPGGLATSPLYPNVSTGPSVRDYNTAVQEGLPSIIVHEAVEFGRGDKAYIWRTGVGPERVYNNGCK